MKIALCQMDMKWLDIEGNISKITDFFYEAEDNGAELTVFPEMALTGFCTDPASAALDIHDPSMEHLVSISRGRKTALIIGAAQKQDNDFVNASLFIRDGDIRCSYFKNRLFTPMDEQKAYKPGKEFLLLEYRDLVFAPLICFDTRFPTIFSRLASESPDAYIIIASWPAAQAEQWKTLLSARAVDTQSYVLGVNRTGIDNANVYNGQTMAFSPGGKPLFEYSEEEKLFYVDIEPQRARDMKKRLPIVQEQYHKEQEQRIRKVKIL